MVRSANGVRDLMSNRQPFPCIKCCRYCTALFAENWGMRLCLKSNHWTGSFWDDGSIPAGADASIDAFVAGVNASFSNVAITWTPTTFFPASPNPADGVVCQVEDTGPYNVWMFDFNTLPRPPWDWYLVPITNIKLIFGAIWQRTHSSPGSIPKICAPAWYWALSFEVDGFANLPLWSGSSAVGGTWPTQFNPDGYVHYYNSANTNSSPHCQVASHIYTAPNTCGAFTQLKDAASTIYVNFLGTNSSLRAVHTTGVPTIPACPP